MIEQDQLKNDAQKPAYEAPEVTDFGSVEEVTEAVASNNPGDLIFANVS